MHRAIPRFLPAAVVLGGVLLAGVATAGRRAAENPNPYPGYRSAIYSDPANWLCRPDKDLIDVNVAMGDLVALARSEGKAYRSHRR